MVTGNVIYLGGANLGGTVRDNLKPGSPAQSFISDTLNSALKAKLADAATSAGESQLASLLQAIPAVDVAASTGLSLRDFVSKEVRLPTDPNAKAAAEAAIAKLSSRTTVGDLLGLDEPIKDHPLFQAEVRKADLSSLLSTSPVVASKQLQGPFITLYAAHQGTIQDFWSRLRQEPAFQAPGVVEDIQFTLQLGLLTFNNVPLVKALQKMRQKGTVKSLKDLVKLDRDTWTKLISTPVDRQPIGIAPNVPGVSPQEKTANYASSIMDHLRAALPTAAVAQSISTPPLIDLKLVKAVLTRNPQVKLGDRIPSNLVLSGLNADDQARAKASLDALRQEINMFPGFDYRAALSETATDARPARRSTAGRAGAAPAAAPTPFQNPMRQGVARFLANSQDFDFQTTHIERYIADHGTAAFQGIPAKDRPAITDQLKRLQRVFRITPKYEEISALLGERLNSAHRITDVPQNTFVRTFQDKLGGETRTSEVYAQAQHVNAGALNLFAQVHQALNDVTPRAIGPVAANLQAALKHVPDWETLFGSLSFCDCEHCRSVLSPAAYFVDLLEFLRNSGTNSANQTPFGVLVTNRRPDLPYIKLTCENTNPPIPYVDMVNEVLEAYVALGQLDATTAKDTGDATPDELSANPEYTNDAAYDKLRTAVYPLTLPFNRPLEVVRTYLGHLGRSWYEVMRTFQKGDPSDVKKGTPTGLAIACEYLRISTEEHGILTGTDLTGAPIASPPTLAQFYGYPVGTDLVASLKPALEFLKRTGISYVDLVELVKTRFVNPTQTVTLDAPADSDPCDLSKMTINIADEAPLKKIHRFIRLARKLGWGYQDLDKTIKAFGTADIDDPFLVKLAALKQLQARLSLSLDQLLSFWADISAEGRDSLYLKLFQNKAVVNPVDPFFTIAYRTHLDKLPGIVFPPTIKISYDAGAKQLAFTGVMTDAERSLLFSLPAAAGLPPDANYELAVDNLFNIRAMESVSLASAGEWITPHVNTILAALHISAADLDSIRTATSLDDSDSTKPSLLTLKNLTILYRHTILARALRIPAKDLISLMTLTGIDPFRAGDPASTVALVDKIAEVRQSFFSVAQLDYLYRDYDPDGGIAPSETDVNILFQDLSSKLKKITDGTGSVPDAMSALGQKLAAVLDNATSVAIMGLVNGTSLYSVPLPKLPDITFTFPDGTGNKISYDPAGKLTFTGVMTDPERAQLLGSSTDAGYQTAITTLYQAHATTAVPLASLPTFAVPDGTSNRISYDANAKVLRFTGAMTTSQRTQLLALAADSNYQTAVQSLYQQPRDFIGTLRKQNSQLLTSLADALAQAIELPLSPKRFGLALARLVARTDLIEQMLSDNLKLDPAMTILLLEGLLKSHQSQSQKAVADFVSADGPAPSGAFVASYRLLHKATLLLNALKITVSNLQYLSLASQDFANFDLNALPLNRSVSTATSIDANAPALFTQWERLNSLFTLKNNLPHGEILFEIFYLVAYGSDTPPPGGVTYLDSRLAVAGGWNQQELDILTGPNGFSLAYNDFRNEIPVVRLQACLNLIRRLGVSAAKVFTWMGAASPDANQARDVKNAAKARYDEQTWLTVAKYLNDPLRESSRIQLISYLLGNDATIQARGITDSSRLYEYFLIDVDMSACMMTSRIKQAISSIQLFVQRCLMNLESNLDSNGNEIGVSPSAIDVNRWNWMKHYRVWEANRRVFLYPENWIEPDLRDDKSPFFKDLESALLQNGITIGTTEQAFLDYLEKLDGVSRLEISGVYIDVEGTLHVFARTFAVPHVYYYRRLVIPSWAWTPWEKVPLDIEGDDLIPVVYNSRLYVFWPIFTEKAPLVNVPGQDLSSQTLQKHWQIQLASSELRNGKWSPKKISTGSLRWPQYEVSELPAKDTFSFKGIGGPSQLLVACYVEQPTPSSSSSVARRDMVALMPQRNGGGGDGSGSDGGSGSGGDPSDPSATASISGAVKGNNAVRLPGVTIFLQIQKKGQTWIQRTSTDSQGNFSLSNLAPGTYTVTAYAPTAPVRVNRKSVDQTVNVGDTITLPDFTFPVSLTERLTFGQFTGQGCEGELVPSYFKPPLVPLFPSPGTHVVGMSFVEDTPGQPMSVNGEGLNPVLVLGKAPSPSTTFDLLPVHQFLEFIDPYLLFFYEDQQRTYFALPLNKPRSSRALTVADTVAPTHSPRQLVSSGRMNVAEAILDATAWSARGGSTVVPSSILSESAALTGLTAAEGLRDAVAREAGALSLSVRGSLESGSPLFTGTTAAADSISNLSFSTYYHPHLCSFMKALNSGGVPGLLTLTNQALTNDPGVISGFLLSTSQNSLTPGLTSGVLVAQGKLLAISSPTLPPAPASAISFVFYGSSPSPGGFYYNSSLMPKTNGDALIGQVVTDSVSVTSTLPASIFRQLYSPTNAVNQPDPLENVDFDPTGAYSSYNWELFFHIPLLIADRLSKNQRFQEAQQWFHYIFNPTDGSDYHSSQRYWKVLPFFANTASGRIEDLMRLLDYSGKDPTLLAEKERISKQIDAWLAKPFDPHLIARLRPIAYQKTVVMKYIDNLIAWGDQLFRQNTIESINEATQLYILAYEILGPRPERVPPRGKIQELTYWDLAGLLDKFSNTLVTLENVFPFGTSSSTSGGPDLSKPLYFCIPQNDKLLGYWDTVGDRLFKIRHCMTIEGQARQLPLFEPPIEPGLLVRAAALGVDLASALTDITTATPFYRFTYVLPKAIELCAEVRSFGSALLAALEKKDTEALSALRATQETSLLKAVRLVKQRQIDEATAAMDGLRKSRAVVEQRYVHYQMLLGVQNATVPAEGAAVPVETSALTFPSPAAGDQQLSTLALTKYEQDQLGWLEVANNYMLLSQGFNLLGSILHLIPQTGSCIPVTVQFGGIHLGDAATAVGTLFGGLSSNASHQANRASIVGQYERRRDEWVLQSNLAGKELEQIDQQISAAQIRTAIAQLELDNHDKQIENAAAVETFLRDKYTNQDLYSWMTSQTATVFFQCYQMAYELAKRAEACFRFERGLKDSRFITFGYWDNLRNGLLAGEKLYLDLKRMELAYMDQNQREYEITRNISLVLFNPLALIALKETGHCTVGLPEAFFDMDYPGHYMRRIKSVGLTIPCVTGPYTSVNCTVTLLKNSTRVNSAAAGNEGNYTRDVNSDDPRFVDDFAATQSIATSSGQNDGGMFELNFRDERYLPFEGAGAISTWQIDLPKDCNAFDFETISDIIMNLKYTAREGGALLRDAAVAERVLPAPPPQPLPPSPAAFVHQPNLFRLFSLRHEFPTDWYKFLNPADTATSQTMSLALMIERFPFQFRGRTIQISEQKLFLKLKDVYPASYGINGAHTPQGDYNAGAPLNVSIKSPTSTVPAGSVTLLKDESLGGLPDGLLSLNDKLGGWQLQVSEVDVGKIAGTLWHTVKDANGNSHPRLNADIIDDLIAVCHYTVA